jgi:adenylate cyclase
VAMGVPMRETFSRADLRWARNTRRFLDVMSVDALIRSARVRGAALSAVARSDLATIRDELLLPMRQAGADDLTMAVALAESTEALEDIARQALVHSYELQLDQHLDGELVAMAARSEREEVDIAVGFLDVEGYTALSSRIDPAGLDAVIEAFEERVLQVTSARPGVSPVKYLGDAVMLVSADPAELADVMLTLTDPVDDLADAPLRGGMAFGAVLVREGDYFGTPVNIAARLTDQARAWSVLADDDLADVLGARFEVKQVRPTRIRGVGTRRPLALLGRREDDGDA